MSLSILALGVGLVGSAVFQTLSMQRFWQVDVKASKDTRHAASWFAEDALRTTSTTLVDGQPAVDTVTIATDSDNITYSLSGGSLVRQSAGVDNIVAENVVSVGFALVEQTLTFTLEVTASRGGTETLTLQNYLRLLAS